VEDLLCESAIRRNGYFDMKRVSRFLAKYRQHKGRLLSERENMALVGILSTQLLDQFFLREFPPYTVQEPDHIRVFTQQD